MQAACLADVRGYCTKLPEGLRQSKDVFKVNCQLCPFFSTCHFALKYTDWRSSVWILTNFDSGRPIARPPVGKPIGELVPYLNND